MNTSLSIHFPESRSHLDPDGFVEDRTRVM